MKKIILGIAILKMLKGSSSNEEEQTVDEYVEKCLPTSGKFFYKMYKWGSDK